jgi:drug/metabolite transporter (DMT)-like permease
MTDIAAPHTTPEQRPLYGIGLMMLSIGVYAVQDAIAKHLAPDFSAVQILFFRAAGAALVLLPLINQVPTGGWITKHPWLMLVRCAVGAGGMACYIIAYRTMSLADVSAVGFSGVLMVTVLSMLVLKEAVDWHRWLAILIGFVGVLIILRPGIGVFTPGAAWSLLGAFGFAVMTLALRVLTRTEHPVMITMYFTVFSIVVLGAFLPAVWSTPSMTALVLLTIQGLMCGVGQVLMSMSLRAAPASTVSPFTYTIMIYGLIIGYFWFGDIPDPLMLAGVSVLIGSCLYIARREQLDARAAQT